MSYEKDVKEYSRQAVPVLESLLRACDRMFRQAKARGSSTNLGRIKSMAAALGVALGEAKAFAGLPTESKLSKEQEKEQEEGIKFEQAS